MFFSVLIQWGICCSGVKLELIDSYYKKSEKKKKKWRLNVATNTKLTFTVQLSALTEILYTVHDN